MSEDTFNVLWDKNVLSGAMRTVDEALTDISVPQRPFAPTRDPESVTALTPIDAHIAEMHEAMLAHNADIEAADLAYADRINASRARLETAQNELRAAERELAARWHGEAGS
jgi:hypothetical protein